MSEKERRVMSLMGHKRTFAVRDGMSAFTPKADIARSQIDVRFVPIVDINGYELNVPFGPNAEVGPRRH